MISSPVGVFRVILYGFPDAPTWFSIQPTKSKSVSSKIAFVDMLDFVPALLGGNFRCDLVVQHDAMCPFREQLKHSVFLNGQSLFQ